MGEGRSGLRARRVRSEARLHGVILSPEGAKDLLETGHGSGAKRSLVAPLLGMTTVRAELELRPYPTSLNAEC